MLSFFKIGGNPFLLIVSLTIVISNLACSDNSENDLTVFKALDESLSNSNTTIQRSTETIYASLEQKLADPITATKAQIWYPKAMMIQKYAGDITAFIGDLKHRLKKAAGLKKENEKEIFNESNKGIVNSFFNENRIGDTLYQKLLKFKTDVLSVDIQMDTVFRQTLLLATRAFDLSNSDARNFTKTFFYSTPVVAALATLSTFQNNVRIIENRMISFCNNKMICCSFFYDVYSAIIGQNSTYVRTGEQIEITAGVGAFSKVAQPEILFGGKKVDIDETGTAVHKFNSPSKPGKYIVPVKISYTDQDGKKRTIEKAVEYTVRR